jgi:hypothetical protein
MPTQMELARLALGTIVGTAGLVIIWFELLRHCF